MCYHTKMTSDAQKVEKRFKAAMAGDMPISTDFNGFAFPETPVLLNRETSVIQPCSWGLLPGWAKSDFKRANTLNARIETIAEKPSFRSYVNNRCLVLVDGFYEWQWLDENGKDKQKYEIGVGGAPFALAGIWAERNGIVTYSIVTTAANELMAEIHNTKKRMPVVLTTDNEQYWLQGGLLQDFFICDAPLHAVAV